MVTIALLSYYGNEGERLLFGLADYLGVGITVGFCLIIPTIFLTYLCDGNILIFVSSHQLKVSIIQPDPTPGVFCLAGGGRVVPHRVSLHLQLLLPPRPGGSTGASPGRPRGCRGLHPSHQHRRPRSHSQEMISCSSR